MQTKQASLNSHPRQGAAAILILLLTSLMFVAIVFSVDIARIQLAQLELQSGVDLATRAGAEALARGVGEGMSNSTIDSLIRQEVEMIAQLNKAGNQPISLNTTANIQFGSAFKNGNGTYGINSSGSYNNTTDSVSVNAQMPNFPVMFGSFVARESVNIAEKSSAMVKERDIVVVLDRSASMLEHDAGTIPVAQYPANLRSLEDDMYGPGEAYYPGGTHYTSFKHTEFEESGGVLNLSRMQAMKLAVLKFREEISASRSREYLGLTTYSDEADGPSDAQTTSSPINIMAGLSNSVRNLMVGDGITYETEHFAAALASESTSYRNFDFNYLGMRRRWDTNIVDGLEKGVDNLYGPGRRSFATPVLILMTDGRHNLAGNPLTTASNLMSSHPEMKIYTVTFGAGADQPMMQSIAAVGNGEHYHATDVIQLVDIFRELANSAGVALIE